MLKGKS